MLPNKHLTSGSSLQIPASALQRSPSAPHDPATESADFSTANLSEQQTIVLRAIANGKSISAAAQEAGISRRTIYRWQRDPNFQQCLDAWRSQTKESGRNIVLTLIERSARVVERALDKDDVRVAVTLLSKLGILATNEPTRDVPAIAGEGAINEQETKINDVATSRGS